MSDKPLVQQALAGELAELILAITSTTASLAFLRGFWTTIVREWNGIDRLRCALRSSFISIANIDFLYIGLTSIICSCDGSSTRLSAC